MDVAAFDANDPGCVKTIRNLTKDGWVKCNFRQAIGGAPHLLEAV